MTRRVFLLLGILASCGGSERGTPSESAAGGGSAGERANSGGFEASTGGLEASTGGTHSSSGSGGNLASGGNGNEAGGRSTGGATPTGGATTSEGGAAIGGVSNAGAAGSGPDPCSIDARLRVTTFNIRYDSGSNAGQNAWESDANPRRERVRSVIQNLNPDLLGIQEALDNQVEDLKAGLDDHEFFGAGRDDGKTKGEYAGIFYRRDRFERIDGGHFWLSTTPDVPGTVFAGSGSIRMATWLVLRDVVSARELFALNTHWDNSSASSRESSAALIRERLSTLAPALPQLVTGDLNESADGPAVRALLSEKPAPYVTLLDAYRAVHPMVEPDERTFHDFSGNSSGTRIDFILHDASLTALSASIDRTSFDGLYPSDHFAVSAELAWCDVD